MQHFRGFAVEVPILYSMMKSLRVAFCVALLSVCGLKADDSGQKPQQPPEEIPDFNNLDEYVYVPKTTLNMGFRFIFTGPKTTFWGNSSIPAPENPSVSGVANISHTYHDGTVNSDSRTISVDDGNGGVTTIPVPSDGKTNTWSYVSTNQITPDDYMTFHTYSAQVADPTSHDRSGVANAGVELAASREMGKLGKRFSWNITAGFSITDIRSAIFANVGANITTVTDTYDLFGQIPPVAPYSSPGSASQNVVNNAGVSVTDSSGTTVTQTVDQTTLLGNVPLSRTTTTAFSADSVTNRYYIDGAYYTLRIGPTLVMPVGSHFKVNLSVGPALIYSGASFGVEEFLYPATGDTIIQTIQKENSHLLPGYYGDLSIQYDVTETAGLYVSALYEGAGSYSQSVGSGDVLPGQPVETGGSGSYSTRINFDNQSGVRAGMTVKF